MKHCVSVIVPVYNGINFLEAAIQSVLSQNFPIEVIVVNDGSDADAAAVITRICSSDNRIRLVHQVNMGPAAARCNGVRHAKGDYILFLDADDFLYHGAIAYLVDALCANPQAVASYGVKTMLHMDQTGKITEEYILPERDMVVSGNILPALLSAVPLLSNGNICIRREFAKEILFPQDVRQGEDWITWCRLALLGDIIYAGDSPVVCIRLHACNSSNKALNKPSELFEAVKLVFKDKDFIERIGREKLAEYYMKYRRYLHLHFYVSFRNRRQYFRMIKHRIFWYAWAPVCALYEKYAQLAEDKAWHAGVEPKGSKLRVVHVVKWFHAGGAERLITALMQHSDKARYEHIVLSLSDRDERIRDIPRTLGIPLKVIGMKHGEYNFIQHVRGLLFLIKVKPDVIKTWLPQSNITGGIWGRILGIPVIWGLHDAQRPQSSNAKRQIPLSRFIPRKIVCCSPPVYELCCELGYNKNMLKVIINGTDTDMFSPSPEGRERVRKECGIDHETILIGMAAEFIPTKRHRNFLVAAKIFLSFYPNTQFLLCGRNVTQDNPLLKLYLQVLDIEKRVHLLGIRNDMGDIYSALDIHTLNSDSESFGLAVTEAMACKTLCVATDVGIMAELLKEVGIVIPVSKDPHVLADAWKKLVEMPAQEKSIRLEKGRVRVKENYSIADTARQYDETYASVL